MALEPKWIWFWSFHLPKYPFLISRGLHVHFHPSSSLMFSTGFYHLALEEIQVKLGANKKILGCIENNWVVATQIFLMFIPIWGRWTHFDENIFQMGWNFQLDKTCRTWRSNVGFLSCLLLEGPKQWFSLRQFLSFVVIHTVVLLDDHNIQLITINKIFFFAGWLPPILHKLFPQLYFFPVQEVKEQTQTALKKQSSKKLDVSQQFSPFPELKDRGWHSCGVVVCRGGG